MRKTMLFAALAFAATPALAEDLDFVLINGSGKPIKTIEISPTGSATWVANKLNPEQNRPEVVKIGGRATVYLEKSGSQCRYDIKATFQDGASAVWTGANVCDNSFITIKLVGDKTTLTAN